MDNSETLNPTTGKREWCLVSCKRRYCLCRLLSLGQCGSLKLWFLFASVLEGLASVGSGSLVRFTPQRNLSLKQINHKGSTSQTPHGAWDHLSLWPCWLTSYCMCTNVEFHTSYVRTYFSTALPVTVLNTSG